MTNSNKMSLTMKILIGLAAGFAVGLLLNLLGVGVGIEGFKGSRVVYAEGATPTFLQTWLVAGLFNLGGSVFISTLKLLVVPVVLVSLICGVVSLDDISKLGRVGGKTLGLYLLTTCCAITIALLCALVIQPGGSAEDIQALAQNAGKFQAKEAPPLVQVLIDIFPTNPFASMASGKMLQIIVFAILFGLGINLAGKSGQRVGDLFKDLNEVVMQLVHLLMEFAPIGVFCLVAKTFTVLGFGLIVKLALYFATVLIALGLHALLVYPLFLKALTGLNPFMFFHNIRPPLAFAFSTASSGATIPITLEAVEERMGVKNSIASFTIPLGATVNMDGTAIMQGVATVFIAQAFGYNLVFNDYLLVIVTATLASIGTAGVPGVGLIMLAMVLNQVGIDPAHIGVIIGVDRLLDMTRTAVNITGDCMVTCVVAKGEKALSEEVFYAKQA